MRQLDLCIVCGEFTEVFRYKRQWLCDKCPKVEADAKIEKIQEDIKENYEKLAKKDRALVYVPSTKATENKASRKPNFLYQPPKKPRVIKPKTPKTRKVSMKETIRMFFAEHPNSVFTMAEITAQFPQYVKNSIRNALIYLLNDHQIYSRKININGRNSYSIYGVSYQLVNEMRSEENVSKVAMFIENNYPVTTKQLETQFNISDKGLAKLLDKVPTIERYNYKNRNFYFPVSQRSKCVNIIQETIKSNNQYG